MKFIQPGEIFGKIITLINESDDFVLLVSPYLHVTELYKLHNALKDAMARNVHVMLYIRSDQAETEDVALLKNMGVVLYTITNLHAKLYMNERYGIVTSFNLSLNSAINSLEIGYKTETDSEYEELKDFSMRYLKVEFKKSTEDKHEEIVGLDNFGSYLCDALSEINGRNARAKFQDSSLNINTGINNYNCFIYNKRNVLRISGILSGQEYEQLSTNIDCLKEIKNLELELQKGEEGYYSLIWGTSKLPIKSHTIDQLFDNEAKYIADTIIDFVGYVDHFKMNRGKVVRDS